MAFSNKTASILSFSRHLSLNFVPSSPISWTFYKKKWKKKEPTKTRTSQRSRWKTNPPKSPKEIPHFQTAWLSNCAPSHWAFWAPSAFTKTQLHPPFFSANWMSNSKLNSQKKQKAEFLVGGNFFCPKKPFLKIVLFVCFGLCHIFIKIPPFFGHRFWPLLLFFVIPKSIQTSDLQIDGPDLASASGSGSNGVIAQLLRELNGCRSCEE